MSLLSKVSLINILVQFRDDNCWRGGGVVTDCAEERRLNLY